VFIRAHLWFFSCLGRQYFVRQSLTCEGPIMFKYSD
jgi:hypothetical protein